MDETTLGERLLYVDLNDRKEKCAGVNRKMESCVLYTLLQICYEWEAKSREMKWPRLVARMVEARNELLFLKFAKKRGATWESWNQTTL
jgi:hypothetical protein